MKADLTVIGFSAGARQFRVAAAATAINAGEPVGWEGTLTAGVASVNTVVVLTTGKPVVATDSFIGVAAQATASSAGSVTAQKFLVEQVVPNITIIRAKAKTATNIATDSQLLGVLFDVTTFDLTATVYTINETSSGSNTDSLQILNGDTTKGTLDVTVDARALRYAVS